MKMWAKACKDMNKGFKLLKCVSSVIYISLFSSSRSFRFH